MKFADFHRATAERACHLVEPAMTALKQPDFITMSDYLAGEEISDTKHEYLGGTVTLHRRLPEGGFTIERHSGLDAFIPLPEIDASLSLANLYERVEFAP